MSEKGNGVEERKTVKIERETTKQGKRKKILNSEAEQEESQTSESTMEMIAMSPEMKRGSKGKEKHQGFSAAHTAFFCYSVVWNIEDHRKNITNWGEQALTHQTKKKKIDKQKKRKQRSQPAQERKSHKKVSFLNTHTPHTSAYTPHKPTHGLTEHINNSVPLPQTQLALTHNTWGKKAASGKRICTHKRTVSCEGQGSGCGKSVKHPTNNTWWGRWKRKEKDMCLCTWWETDSSSTVVKICPKGGKKNFPSAADLCVVQCFI